MNLRTDSSCRRRPSTLPVATLEPPPSASAAPLTKEPQCVKPSSVQSCSVVGAVCVALGLLPVPDLVELADPRPARARVRRSDCTIVSELAADAGVFDRLADVAARIGGGRTIGLWGAVVVLAVLCTVFLSIDTTAVLLTPIVIALARRVDLPPMPFALTTVWLANTASLLLPVSNLTNLLAVDRIGRSTVRSRSPALMVWAALAGVVVPCAVLLVVFRGKLFGRYTPVTVRPPADRVFFRRPRRPGGPRHRPDRRGRRCGSPRVVAAVALVVVAAFRAPSRLKPLAGAVVDARLRGGSVRRRRDAAHDRASPTRSSTRCRAARGPGRSWCSPVRAGWPRTRSTTCPPTWCSSRRPAEALRTPRCSIGVNAGCRHHAVGLARDAAVARAARRRGRAPVVGSVHGARLRRRTADGRRRRARAAAVAARGRGSTVPSSGPVRGCSSRARLVPRTGPSTRHGARSSHGAARRVRPRTSHRAARPVLPDYSQSRCLNAR